MAALLLASATTLPAFAQAPAGNLSQRPVTKWEAVDQPLSALLDGGYKIIAMTAGIFTLEKDGKYILCELRPAGGLSGNKDATSECHKLN
jgi:hypothetical protein